MAKVYQLKGRTAIEWAREHGGLLTYNHFDASRAISLDEADSLTGIDVGWVRLNVPAPDDIGGQITLAQLAMR